jgi:uncharacterized surface protein with fasciclin (FAS1) repeats
LLKTLVAAVQATNLVDPLNSAPSITVFAPTVHGNPVLCGNIPTKNATVFVIGKVLTPGTNKS